jgi:hypothetical protein
MLESHPHLPPEVEADLVALADGNLSRARAADVEARVAADPALAAALERQRAALALLAELRTPGPPELRLRVEELRSHRRRLVRRRWIPAGLVAGVAATAALALLLLAGGGPAVEDVFAVGVRPATAAPAAREQLDGVRFPRPRAWRAVGSRSDVVDGRATRTVFYERAGRRIAYTIVSGRPLQEAGRRWLRTAEGRRVAFAWERWGHTCVISGAVDRAALAAAAGWR